MRRVLVLSHVLFIGLAVASARPAMAGEIVQFTIVLDGAQEVPPNDSPGSGVGTATLDLGNNLFSWNITFSGLVAPEVAAHFHGPAVMCESAGVQVGLPFGSPKVGSQILTAPQAAQVLTGRWYVNIHSSAFPGGEIRGQVMPAALDDPIPGGIAPGSIHVKLQPFASGLTAPNWGAAPPGDTSRLFVVDQDGKLWAIRLSDGAKSVFLDVDPLLVALGAFGPGTFDERGFLGVAFHPDYAKNGLLYTYTSQPLDGPADFSTMPQGQNANHQAVITEWHVPDPGNPDSVVDPKSARVMLRVDEPQFNHNAGCINFGPDGLLYIALGDGGGADDKDGQNFIGQPIIGHGCVGNGADNTNVLGDILRIDPLGSNSTNGQYGIPADNPFVGGPGVDEIYAMGFRNPFRFSFDSLTGDMYVGDVGQNEIEEINVVVKGGHYGWNHKEGSFFFVPNGKLAGYVTDRPLSVPGGLIDPIAQYDHDEGISVIGGFVYRGNRIAPLKGRYVFGEFAVQFDNDGRLFYLGDGHEILEFPLVDQAVVGLSILGFGQDAKGELYLMANSTGVPFGNTGVVLRLTLRPGDLDGDGCVGQSDLGILLAAFNNTPAGDLDEDGDTDQSDLGILLANFGAGCP
jgi:glucose/arabinose dehydrogenase